MKNTTQIVTLTLLYLAGLVTTSITLAAILTRYEGTIDVKVGPTGGQVRVVGGSQQPSLPPAN